MRLSLLAATWGICLFLAGGQADAAAGEEPRHEAEPAIRITPGSTDAADADLGQAYMALQEGRIDAAAALYRKSLQAAPKNVDALLGLATVAARQGRPEEAGRWYFQALELEPQNPVAQAGLLGLMGAANPAASEARLKQLIARQPAAFLHTSLANLYAGQKRWTEAQQAYFQAHQLEPEHPDYAFNLAVSLERLGQPKLALEYYQRARQLMSVRGGAGFEAAVAEARIARLGNKRNEP